MLALSQASIVRLPNSKSESEKERKTISGFNQKKKKNAETTSNFLVFLAFVNFQLST